MTELTDINYVDPLEGSSCTVDESVKDQIKSEGDDEDDNYNTMALLELATCVETHQEPIEFTPIDAALYPKTGLMVCLLCLEDVETNLLNDHMVNAHGYRKVQFKCQICGMKFGERSLLMAHKKECRPQEKRHKRKSFQQIMKELDSKNYDGDGNPGACPICSIELPRYCIREHLIMTHMEPELSLTCEICKRTFKNKLTLREHVKLVHDCVEETEECEECGQRFRSHKYLTNHKRNVHPTDNRVHTCTVCGKTFKSRLCLHQHGKHVHPPAGAGARDVHPPAGAGARDVHPPAGAGARDVHPPAGAGARDVHPPAGAAARCPRCPAGKLFKSKVNLHQHLRVSHGLYKDPTLGSY